MTPSIVRPPLASGKIKVTAWRPFQKNTLQGFVEFTLPSGLIIRDCCLHERDAKRWISLPGRPYEKNGQTEYVAFLDFTSRERRNEFQSAALEAIDDYLAQEQSLG